MSTVLHGEGKPKIILDAGEATETTIILPYCKNLVEQFEPDILQKKLYNGTLSTTIRGWWYKAILDYSDRIDLETLQNLDQDGSGLQSLFDAGREGVMRFYPRSSSIYYEVELDPDSILMLQQRPFHQGHRGVKIVFNGVTRLTEIDLVSTS